MKNDLEKKYKKAKGELGQFDVYKKEPWFLNVAIQLEDGEFLISLRVKKGCQTNGVSTHTKNGTRIKIKFSKIPKALDN